MASTLQGNFATQIYVAHLFIDSHGCGRFRDVVHDIHIDQFEDLLQNIEVTTLKIGNDGRTYLSHCNSLSLVSQGEPT